MNQKNHLQRARYANQFTCYTEFMSRKTYWFKRRRFGYGWVPVTKQGWAVVISYLAIVLVGAWLIKDTPENTFTTGFGVYLASVLIASIVAVTISYKKGPAPRWRWGSRPDDDPDIDW